MSFLLRAPPVLLLAAIAAVPGCTGDHSGPRRRSAALTSIEDASAVRGVVAVVGGLEVCNGVLIARRVVLTAGRCFETVRDPGIQVYFGTDLAALSGSADPDEIREVVHIHRPVEFTLAIETAHHDVALLLLDRDAPASATEWPVATRPRSEGPPPGSRARVVGFGLEPPSSSHQTRPTTRRQGPILFQAWETELTSFRLDPPDDTCTSGVSSRLPNFPPREDAGHYEGFLAGEAADLPCFSVTGSPAFVEVDGGEEVLAITTRSRRGCTNHCDATRIDRLATDLLAPFLRAVAPGAAKLGDRCYDAQGCAEGSCVPSVGLPSVSYCSRPCAGDSDCPSGMGCGLGDEDVRMCRYPRAHPGVLGRFCPSAANCETGRCARPAAGALRQCTVPCDPGQAPACPRGFTCGANPEETGTHACFLVSQAPPSAGGCGAAPEDGRSPALPWWLGALLLFARRRRRSFSASSSAPPG